MKSLQREIEQNRKNSITARMLLVMSDNGASEQSMQKAYPGLAEFAKYAIKSYGNLASANPGDPQSTLTPEEEVLGLLLAQVETQEVHWLWEKRIPLGKITILDGDPGMGKSLLAIHLAACVTTGSPMPDGMPCQQGGVILVAPEDGASDTLRPRLEAAAGDPARVLLLNEVEGLDAKKKKVLDRPFSLSQDLDKLEAAIKRTNAVLVILDPLMAVLGHNIDSSRDQHIREVFTPLAQLAERANCAILVIRHLTKKRSSENAIYRGAGSIGIIAAARTGLIVARDPYEEHRRTLATTKNNLSSKASNLSFQVVENASGIPYIQWLGENNYTLTTLLDSGMNTSIERYKILQVLKEAPSSLGPQEVAELTGQNYTMVRQTLKRMYEAKDIARPYRGRYTTFDHPSLQKRSTSSNAKTNDTFNPSVTTVTKHTSVTNNKSEASDAAPKFIPWHEGVR